jgi:hypothetical protein
MNCQETRSLWGSRHDGELDVNLAAEIARHLEGCPDCRQIFETQQRFEAALTGALKAGQATPDLWQREESAIREAFAQGVGVGRDTPDTERLGFRPLLTALASMLWPSPKFHAGLAALWFILWVVNWQVDATQPGTAGIAKPSPARDAMFAAQRREFLIMSYKL